MTPANVRLFKLLADLFPDAAMSQMVMAETGMEASRINVEQPPKARWYFVVAEAEKAGLIDELLTSASAQYPDNAELQQMRGAAGRGPVIKRPVVLAIWPDTPGQQPLDQTAEAEAIYAVGLDYIALDGAEATRDAVVREWSRRRPNIVVVGAHGLDGEIYLSDGPTRIGWWTRLVRRHAPQLVLMMACESSSSAKFDIPDAMIRAGVQAVIAVSDSILDTDAILFERVFWENYTSPMPVTDAVDIARSVLSNEGSQMVVLLEAQ